jgi:hypothetical protein
MHISDTPVTERHGDVLGRWGLAKSIFDLVNTVEDVSALRVGVYGGWGEGKTSVLRFVETQANQAQIPVCWFPVWAAQTPSELWRSLLQALQTLPDGADRRTWLKSTCGKAVGKIGGLAQYNPYTKAGHALAALVAESISVGPEDAMRAIVRVSGHRRVIIWVDDVDRADPVLVPKLLMGLHDLLSELPGCAVVVALDPGVVSGSLGSVNPGWSSAQAFLEKIIQYPFHLPSLTEERRRQLVLQALQQSQLSIPSQALLDILQLLPRNPRKLKQFIRGLQRFEATVRRLDEDEWDPTLLLFLELLRAVSAEVAELLIQDPQFMQELVAGHLPIVRSGSMERELEERQSARMRDAVDRGMLHQSDAERRQASAQLSAICAEASERLQHVVPSECARHARLDHEPPIMTIRECRAIVAEWRSDRSAPALSRLLLAHRRANEQSEHEVLGAMVGRTVAILGHLIDEAAGALSQSASVQAEKMAELIELLEQLILGCDALGKSDLHDRVELFVEVRNRASHLANRLDDDRYAPIRERMRRLLYSAAPRLSDRAVDLLNHLKPWDAPRLSDMVGAAEIDEVRNRLSSLFGMVAANSTVDRFRRPGGVAGVGNFITNPTEIWLLTDADSPFHESEPRARLMSMVSVPDHVVAQNCLFYLSMLISPAETGRLPLAPARDPDFVVPLWEAVLTLEPAMGLRERISEVGARLRRGLGDPSLIRTPAWESDNGRASP